MSAIKLNAMLTPLNIFAKKFFAIKMLIARLLY